MERLSQLIVKHVQEGKWKAIQLGKDGPPISHLFFADDLVLFTKASFDQVTFLENVFRIFCDSSGQKISKQKSIVFFSRNVHQDRINELGRDMGMVVTTDLGRYLGVPIIHGRITKQMYAYVVDKMKRRISDWSTKYLSMVGRLVLSQSVLSASPLFTMQSAVVPKATCHEIDMLRRKFIWGHSTDRRIHLVSWDKLCQPKGNGGLGGRPAKSYNEAILMKLSWDVFRGHNLLWVDVLSRKYGVNGNSSGVSSLWKAIQTQQENIMKATAWCLGMVQR